MPIEVGREMLYLSRADVESLGITPSEINASVEAAFLAKAEGRGFTKPKIYIRQPDGQVFMAKAGVLRNPSYAAIKWLGFFPANAAKGLTDYHPMVLLSEGETGRIVALMDGTWLTELRTGSMSAVAAKYMAKPGSRRIGFVACGSQARGHVRTMRAIFPPSEVVAYSRRLETAEAFAAWARAEGLDARAVADPRQAIEGMDIVVTSVPHLSIAGLVLETDWLSPGTFVSMVDLGNSWRRESLLKLDRVVTDDVEQSGPEGTEKLNYPGTLAGEIADLVSGKLPGRASPQERNAFIFSGVGLGDVGPAMMIYERALAAGKGHVLPL